MARRLLWFFFGMIFSFVIIFGALLGAGAWLVKNKSLNDIEDLFNYDLPILVDDPMGIKDLSLLEMYRYIRDLVTDEDTTLGTLRNQLGLTELIPDELSGFDISLIDDVKLSQLSTKGVDALLSGITPRLLIDVLGADLGDITFLNYFMDFPVTALGDQLLTMPISLFLMDDDNPESNELINSFMFTKDSDGTFVLWTDEYGVQRYVALESFNTGSDTTVKFKKKADGTYTVFSNPDLYDNYYICVMGQYLSRDEADALYDSLSATPRYYGMTITDIQFDKIMNSMTIGKIMTDLDPDDILYIVKDVPVMNLASEINGLVDTLPIVFLMEMGPDDGVLAALAATQADVSQNAYIKTDDGEYLPFSGTFAAGYSNGLYFKTTSAGEETYELYAIVNDQDVFARSTSIDLSTYTGEFYVPTKVSELANKVGDLSVVDAMGGLDKINSDAIIQSIAFSAWNNGVNYSGKLYKKTQNLSGSGPDYVYEEAEDGYTGQLYYSVKATDIADKVGDINVVDALGGLSKINSDAIIQSIAFSAWDNSVNYTGQLYKKTQNLSGSGPDYLFEVAEDGYTGQLYYPVKATDIANKVGDLNVVDALGGLGKINSDAIIQSIAFAAWNDGVDYTGQLYKKTQNLSGSGPDYLFEVAEDGYTGQLYYPVKATDIANKVGDLNVIDALGGLSKINSDSIIQSIAFAVWNDGVDYTGQLYKKTQNLSGSGPDYLFEVAEDGYTGQLYYPVKATEISDQFSNITIRDVLPEPTASDSKIIHAIWRESEGVYVNDFATIFSRLTLQDVLEEPSASDSKLMQAIWRESAGLSVDDFDTIFTRLTLQDVLEEPSASDSKLMQAIWRESAGLSVDDFGTIFTRLTLQDVLEEPGASDSKLMKAIWRESAGLSIDDFDTIFTRLTLQDVLEEPSASDSKLMKAIWRESAGLSIEDFDTIFTRLTLRDVLEEPGASDSKLLHAIWRESEGLSINDFDVIFTRLTLHDVFDEPTASSSKLMRSIWIKSEGLSIDEFGSIFNTLGLQDVIDDPGDENKLLKKIYDKNPSLDPDSPNSFTKVFSDIVDTLELTDVLTIDSGSNAMIRALVYTHEYKLSTYTGDFSDIPEDMMDEYFIVDLSDPDAKHVALECCIMHLPANYEIYEFLTAGDVDWANNVGDNAIRYFWYDETLKTYFKADENTPADTQIYTSTRVSDLSHRMSEIRVMDIFDDMTTESGLGVLIKKSTLIVDLSQGIEDSVNMDTLTIEKLLRFSGISDPAAYLESRGITEPEDQEYIQNLTISEMLDVFIQGWPIIKNII